VAILTILEFPDERLRKKAQPVNHIDDSIRKIVADMIETMYEAKGIGLAATQVNIQQQIIVIDISDEKNQPLCLINPQLISKQGTANSEEGCLSVPGFFEKLNRATNITLEAYNQQGEKIELTANGLLAVCIQHEMDHLEGKLFVDYLSPLKRQRIKTKLEKIHRFNRK
jgi:peptide deformylase